jgi:putative aldouronate transport system permease protein
LIDVIPQARRAPALISATAQPERSSSMSNSPPISALSVQRTDWITRVQSALRQRLRQIATNWQLYLLILPIFIYFLIFKYVPMYGVQIAFKDFDASAGIWGSPWVGFKHFVRFFNSFQFWPILQNTLFISVYALIASFPLPIAVALMLNQLTSERFKGFVQTVIYAPTFISTVVLVGMLYVFFAPNGMVNNLVELFGGKPIQFMARPEWFPTLYVWSGVWQGTGFATIVYLAALTGVDPGLHEAAKLDGANKLQRIWHIDVPALIPTITILLILAVGNIMNVGFEKILLMQTSLNKSASQVIQTYVYEVGLVQAQYSFSAAVGLFNSIINLLLLVAFNQLARRFSETSLW